MLHPGESATERHPAQWAMECYGTGKDADLSRAALRRVCEEILGKTFIDVDKVSFPPVGFESEVMLPLDAYVLDRISMPEAGVIDLPRTSQWENFFLDVLSENFDSSREPLRGFKHSSQADNSVTLVGVNLQRGFTRVSILYFIAHWATKFFQQNKNMAVAQPQELESMRKCPPLIASPRGGYIVH